MSSKNSASKGKGASNTYEQRTIAAAWKLPDRLFNNQSSSSLVLECIDCHAGGEPARVVIGGLPRVPGTTAFEKRDYMMNHLDWIREILLLEPRGYPCQNVNFLFDAVVDETNNNDNTNKCQAPSSSFLRYVIGEQGKLYPAMSGHNTICVATALLECGIVEMLEPITQFTLEAPAGLVHITASCQDGKAESITFRNTQPAFVECLNVKVNVPGGIGEVIVDIAYGGMWYAVVDAASIGLDLDATLAKKICNIGQMIKVATREQHPVTHPNLDYPGVDILVFRGKATPGSGADSRNAVVMTNQELDWDKPETWTGMLDRSPCGTGTCAVMAVMHARGELQIGQPFVHESIIGSLFTGVLVEETDTIAGRRAVIPEITGSAYITQYSKVVVDPKDPFPRGFRVGDIW